MVPSPVGNTLSTLAKILNHPLATPNPPSSTPCSPGAALAFAIWGFSLGLSRRRWEASLALLGGSLALAEVVLHTLPERRPAQVDGLGPCALVLGGAMTAYAFGRMAATPATPTVPNVPQNE